MSGVLKISVLILIILLMEHHGTGVVFSCTADDLLCAYIQSGFIALHVEALFKCSSKWNGHC